MRSHTNKLPCGEASFRGLVGVYKRIAKGRGNEWGLTRDQARSLMRQPCHYCGVAPQQIYRNSKTSNGAFVYNGIDRADNSLGYLPENAVSCCGMCNKAKRDVPVEEFLAWIVRAYEHGLAQEEGEG